MKCLTYFSIGLLGACLANAQEFQRFTFDAGAGFTEPVGRTGTQLDMGWNAGFGAGMNFTSYLGTMLQVNYNDMGINNVTLNNLGVAGGDVSIWSFTIDPRVHLTPRKPFDLYLVGGGGLYHRELGFTAPPSGFSPFFTSFTSSVNRPGYNVGAGIGLGSKWHAKFFAEARWNRMFINNYHDDWVPVTFGVTF